MRLAECVQALAGAAERCAQALVRFPRDHTSSADRMLMLLAPATKPQGFHLLDGLVPLSIVRYPLEVPVGQRSPGVTPLRPSNKRNKRRTARDRWIRVIKTVLSSLQLEAEEHPEAQRILDRVDGVRAEVRRRLRASNGAPEDDDDGGDIENGPGHARQPQLPSRWFSRSGRGGLLHAIVEFACKIRAIEFSYITPIALRSWKRAL
jgi:hypothetical protein